MLASVLGLRHNIAQALRQRSRPWREDRCPPSLRRRRRRHVGLTPAGELDMAQLRAVLGPRTRLVATYHMSNVTGAVRAGSGAAGLACIACTVGTS